MRRLLHRLRKLARSLFLRPQDQTSAVGPVWRIGSAAYPFDHFVTAPVEPESRQLVHADIKRAADRGDWDWPE